MNYDKLLVLVSLLLLSGCIVDKEEIKKRKDFINSYSLECNDLGSIDRCENSEVICYRYTSGHAGGLSCVHKDKL
jgi:hypothetical protein